MQALRKKPNVQGKVPQKPEENFSRSRCCVFVIKTANGLEKFKSIFKSFQKPDGSPRKHVKFQIPEDVKMLYEDDPEMEEYVVEEMQSGC